MEDLLAVEQGDPPINLEHIRLLKLIRCSGGFAVKLPLRSKELDAVKWLCDRGFSVRGVSG